MDETRLMRLENQIGDLRERAAKSDEATEHLSEEVSRLSDNVAELTAVLNKGRGAFWAANALTAGLASLITLGSLKIFGGP